MTHTTENLTERIGEQVARIGEELADRLEVDLDFRDHMAVSTAVAKAARAGTCEALAYAVCLALDAGLDLGLLIDAPDWDGWRDELTRDGDWEAGA